MTTTDWLRAKIGPAPQHAPAEKIPLGGPDEFAFFTCFLRPDMRVLHANCNDGKSSLKLATHLRMGELVAIDPDISNVRTARSRTSAVLADISVERCTVDSLPFADSSFDAVLLNGALAAAISPERALEEVRRVLVSGGLLGARHTVSSSRVLTDESPLVERALSRRDAVLRDLGGDPEVGLRQPGLFRSTGFVNVRVTSSTRQRSDDDLLAELSRGGFVQSNETEPISIDEETDAVIAFETVVETVGWRPAG